MCNIFFLGSIRRHTRLVHLYNPGLRFLTPTIQRPYNIHRKDENIANPRAFDDSTFNRPDAAAFEEEAFAEHCVLVGVPKVSVMTVEACRDCQTKEGYEIH
jgi:hypothetical protein